LHQKTVIGNILLMGFNKRKMEDRRRDAAEKEAASRRARLMLISFRKSSGSLAIFAPRSAAPPI
jgi:hypothetical protein